MPDRPQREMPAAQPEGGVLAGRYQMEGYLGQGGTADVFLGKDLRLGRPVAVKRFRPSTRAVAEDRFCEEGVLLARLRHPNLVTVYDAGRDSHGAYLVMDHIDGITLRQRIATGPLRYDDVVRLGRRLSSALAHVHAAGVVHRDMKPSNVLLNADGEPFLADFGVSRPIDEPTRAEPGTLVGTVAYMAPEQILGNGSGPASDVYALGLVLLECLKGAREFQGALPEVGYARLMRSPETEDVPEPLRPILEAMTRSDPRSRPDAARCATLFRSVPDAWVRPPSTTPKAGAHWTVPADTDSPPAPQPRRRRVPLVLTAVGAAAVMGTAGIVLAVSTGGHHPPDAADHHPATATPSATTSTTPSPPRATGSPRQAATMPPADRSSAPTRATAVARPGEPGHGAETPPAHGHSAGHGKGLAKGKHKTKS